MTARFDQLLEVTYFCGPEYLGPKIGTNDQAPGGNYINPHTCEAQVFIILSLKP